jgi:hypothetical protein
MAIYRLIANGSFGPDEIEVMTAAYEGALIDLRVANRDDPITELIAKTIALLVNRALGPIVHLVKQFARFRNLVFRSGVGIRRLLRGHAGPSFLM